MTAADMLSIPHTWTYKYIVTKRMWPHIRDVGQKFVDLWALNLAAFWNGKQLSERGAKM